MFPTSSCTRLCRRRLRRFSSRYAALMTPTWVSTAGGGVAWLHVRLDSAPKYYTHRPYTRFAGGGARSLRAAAFAGSGGRQDEGAWREGTSLR